MKLSRPLWVLVLVTATALAGIFARGDQSLDRLQKSGVIRIGYAVEAPYAFVDENGRVSGEAPEIASRIASRLGIARVAWRQMQFGELIDALLSDRVDVIAAGMFITPERQQRVLFSVPTLAVRPGLLVARGNPRRIVSHQQAVVAGMRIAVLQGAVEEQILRHEGIPDAHLVRVPDALTGRVAVESGLADALMLSEPTLRWMAQQKQLGRSELVNPAREIENSSVYGRPAFAFRPDAGQLHAAWNAALIPYLGSAEHRSLLARLGLQAIETGRASE